MTNREAVYKVLMVIAKRQGYILSRDIEDVCIETELSLIDTDWVSSRIIQQGIPVLDDIPEKKHSNGKAAKETSYDEVIETSHTSDVFEKHPSTKTSASILDGIYYCRGKGLSYEAQMEVRDGFYILLKGSRINHKQGPSLTKKLSQIRNSPQYIKDYVVVEEIFFTSPSSAAKIVTGRSTNGWTFWSTKDGLLIDSLRE